MRKIRWSIIIGCRSINLGLMPEQSFALVISIPLYRVGQINLHKFQMVGNTHTKRNRSICFIQVIGYICISQYIVMFYQSMKIIEWSKRKETPSPNYAPRVAVLLTKRNCWNIRGWPCMMYARNMIGLEMSLQLLTSQGGTENWHNFF